MKETLWIMVVLVVFIILADITGYVLWELSGQTPADGFYVGAITNSILK
jgi:flagellar basal body-associated protein FliL